MSTRRNVATSSRLEVHESHFHQPVYWQRHLPDLQTDQQNVPILLKGAQLPLSPYNDPVLCHEHFMGSLFSVQVKKCSPMQRKGRYTIVPGSGSNFNMIPTKSTSCN